ncbi:hypothetical protein COCSADRAFT_160206 [Bipolaris sorokiniana ND90Pr]|uniref:Uncharacterized protein n=1 Tax=Cochliobolus sativus (strain ND90Pr / ATCC 201652) TaxID=665912 RepID=M2SSH4_COCSN|nr:uncharacterized protein COCSADRAFT_160206 [Bipolaris sorokiniana ND90Pr]EMD65235.1 hypothetical protein COCSADRAFT_160206 [Bipolaris sorokiniana ND90Pr]
MGAFLSSEAPSPRPAKSYILSFPEEDFPEEASKAPEDVQDWYSHFFETLFCLPHKDGKAMLILEAPDDFVPDSRARPGWARKRLRGAYELLGKGHPRIVRYLGPLESDIGVIVERLEPGPIEWNALPALTVPLPQNPSQNDRLLLSLYYRWALQLVWLRSDFSLAITGFLAALAPQIEEENRRDRIASARERLQDPAYLNPIELEEFDCRVSEEGYYWAIFVKYLVNNVLADASASQDEMPDEIEDARLGNIIANAEKGHYKDAAKVMEDVKGAALKMGIKIGDSDEVDIGAKWEDVFEVCERQLRFREEE